ncbi:hypothetical protein ABMA27_001356 [Loxostege sticticalis]|uniref:PiggyBac transposable element-derived protein domain-containing protein n=1 Tax=Loxostege sticticalis TaxID=481309 RepID=A0ABR3HY81_LOXSC
MKTTQTDEDFDLDLFNLQSDTSSTSSESNNLVSSEDDSDASDEIQPNAIPSEANANGENEWQDIDDSIPSFEEFTENCKINITDDTVNPEDYYNLFVTDDVISKMVVETNNYAQKFLARNQLKPKSRVRAWIPTNPDEMKKFLGVIMVMGRFLLLLKFWHFSEENPNDKNKFAKITDVYYMLLQRFQAVLIPGKYLIIDETMIPWRGRLKFRQYLKGKSHKYGVKLYKLCTPDGYTFNVNIYSGKGDNDRELNHGKETVLRLIRGLENEGRTVVTDNFYNSIDLAEELIRKKKTFLCGTLRPNRKGLPKRIIASKLKRGKITGAMNKNGVRIIKWVDKRPNDNKKGFSDQMSSYYTTLKRGIKWYRKVMLELLFGTALVNSWCTIFGSQNQYQKKISSKQSLQHKPKCQSRKLPQVNYFFLLDCQNDVVLTKKHTFEKKGDKRRMCAGCYHKLRGTLSSREANKKVKKIKSFCVECKKGYCLSCFYKTHI